MSTIKPQVPLHELTPSPQKEEQIEEVVEKGVPGTWRGRRGWPLQPWPSLPSPAGACTKTM